MALIGANLCQNAQQCVKLHFEQVKLVKLTGLFDPRNFNPGKIVFLDDFSYITFRRLTAPIRLVLKNVEFFYASFGVFEKLVR